MRRDDGSRRRNLSLDMHAYIHVWIHIDVHKGVYACIDVCIYVWYIYVMLPPSEPLSLLAFFGPSAPRGLLSRVS